MDKEGKFFAFCWFLAAVVVVVLVAVSGVNVYYGNQWQDKFRTACISKGNQYVQGNCVVGMR